MQLKVTVPLLNKRNLIPRSLPDAANIAGVVKEGFTFDGEEVDISQLPNPAMGKWYKDRDGHFYWGGGVIPFEIRINVAVKDEFVSRNILSKSPTTIISEQKTFTWFNDLRIETIWNQFNEQGENVFCMFVQYKTVPCRDFRDIEQTSLCVGKQIYAFTPRHGSETHPRAFRWVDSK